VQVNLKSAIAFVCWLPGPDFATTRWDHGAGASYEVYTTPCRCGVKKMLRRHLH
jgi:hypothetical protein